MKAYEVMLLIDPSLDEESHAVVVDKTTGVITGQGGTVDSTEEWGKRRLAYEIKGFTDGARRARPRAPHHGPRCAFHDRPSRRSGL